MTTEPWQTRVANRDDLETLVTFNQTMARETEAKQLDYGILSRGVKTLLEDDRLGFYLLAVNGQQVAGSLMVTSEWSDWRAAHFWWIQSVFVAPEFRRQGVYRALFNTVKKLARERGDICGVRLYVEKENTTAQQTYQALGMEESYYLLYETDSLA